MTTAAVAALLASASHVNRARGAEAYAALTPAGKAQVDAAVADINHRNDIRRPR